MSTPDNAPRAVSVEDAAAIARHAGLPVPEERLERLAAEMTRTREFIDDLERVSIEAVSPIPGPFDPAWPEQANGDAQ